MKVIGALLLIVSFTSMGFLMSARLKNRSLFLQDFIAFLNSLMLHIRYNSLDIK
ncbi:MAG: hypothetical protein ACI4QE_00920, partial [Acutalibacteraceae bacterium]